MSVARARGSFRLKRTANSTFLKNENQDFVRTTCVGAASSTCTVVSVLVVSRGFARVYLTLVASVTTNPLRTWPALIMMPEPPKTFPLPPAMFLVVLYTIIWNYIGSAQKFIVT